MKMLDYPERVGQESRSLSVSPAVLKDFVVSHTPTGVLSQCQRMDATMLESWDWLQ